MGWVCIMMSFSELFAPISLTNLCFVTDLNSHFTFPDIKPDWQLTWCKSHLRTSMCHTNCCQKIAWSDCAINKSGWVLMSASWIEVTLHAFNTFRLYRIHSKYDTHELIACLILLHDTCTVFILIIIKHPRQSMKYGCSLLMIWECCINACACFWPLNSSCEDPNLHLQRDICGGVKWLVFISVPTLKHQKWACSWYEQFCCTLVSDGLSLWSSLKWCYGPKENHQQWVFTIVLDLALLFQLLALEWF